MIKKSLFLFLAFSFLAFCLISNVKAKGKHGPAGKSNIAHLYLYQKDPDTWEIVEDGAWGKMKYNLSGPTFNFVFNGHGLEPGLEYKLIYYPDPWPGKGLICLGEGVANGGDNVHIANLVELNTDLPAEYDDNYCYPEEWDDENCGARIWLVLTNNVDCDNQTMTRENPEEYLFEHNLITYGYDNETTRLSAEQSWSEYEATEIPITNSDPAETKPIGVGFAARAENSLDFMVSLSGFEDQVDIYLAYYIYPLDPDNLYFITETGTVAVPLDTFSIEETLTEEMRFRSGITEPVSWSLDSIPLSDLPPSDYHAYLGVTPHNDTTSYYIWHTYFVLGP